MRPRSSVKGSNIATPSGKPPKGKRVVVDGAMTVRGRGANGSGSVYFDASNQVWVATYRVDGKVRRAQGPSAKEAERRRDEAAARAARAGQLTTFDDQTTLRELADWWLINVAAVNTRPTTVGAARVHLSRLGPLADRPVVGIRSEHLVEWQRALLTRLAPATVRSSRTALRQVMQAGVDHGLIPTNPVARTKAPTVPKKAGRHLAPDDAVRLIAACESSRLGLAVAFLFLQGWRISEVLGLAWQDLDLEAGTATVQRAVVHVIGEGRRLGPTKTAGALGQHELAPSMPERLRRHKAMQAAERLHAGPLWQTHRYEGKRLDMVFTTEAGGLVARQHVDTLLRRKAVEIGLDALGTHAGRRSVVTGLYVAGADLADIARHVGHASTSTTAGYVASLGDRPKRTAALAAELFDRPAPQG